MLAERGHLVRMLLWGGASALIGTLLLLLVSIRPRATTLLSQFALQTAAWGLAEVAISLLWWRTLVPRDIDAFARLERTLWYVAGLETGIVLVGGTLIFAGWMLNRRVDFLGAGTAIVVQGLALVILTTRTLAAIVSLPAP